MFILTIGTMVTTVGDAVGDGVATRSVEYVAVLTMAEVEDTLLNDDDSALRAVKKEPVFTAFCSWDVKDT
jgi:hypothetical protein